jgi:catechol 2,3-dioxygenase-like lactoylglutathione lyase family enzyme
MQLDHVTLIARDCDAFMRFFVDVAGMRIGPRPTFGVDGYWLYLDARPVLHLIGTGGAASAERPASARIDHFALRIDNAAEWAALTDRLETHDYAYQLADAPLARERQLFVRLAPGVVVEFVTARS